METSLRYGRVSKSLRIHTKQKLILPFLPHSFFQVHGELDTKFGVPSYSAILGHFYPNWSAGFRLGVQYAKLKKLQYTVRVKKAFPVTTNGLVSFNIKGQCDAAKDFKELSNGRSVTLCHNSTLLQDEKVRWLIRCPLLAYCSLFQRKFNGAAEFLWSITSFQKDQDVRFKIGYDFIDQIPYMQIRENNWSINADAKGRWNIRYDL